MEAGWSLGLGACGLALGEGCASVLLIAAETYLRVELWTDFPVTSVSSYGSFLISGLRL